jgi:hypothetical protein
VPDVSGRRKGSQDHLQFRVVSDAEARATMMETSVRAADQHCKEEAKKLGRIASAAAPSYLKRPFKC